MITEYIFYQLSQAKYKILDDGSYFGEIPKLKGLWGEGKSLEACREDLREALEDWLVLKLQDGDKIPGFSAKNRSDKRILPILNHA